MFRCSFHLGITSRVQSLFPVNDVIGTYYEYHSGLCNESDTCPICRWPVRYRGLSRKWQEKSWRLFFLSLVSPILKSNSWDKSLYSRRQSILITRNMMFLYPSSFVSRPSQTFNNRSDSLMGHIAFRSVWTILSGTTKSNLSCKKRSNKRTSLVKSVAWNEQELQSRKMKGEKYRL